MESMETNQNTSEIEMQISQEQVMNDILNFRDQLLAREILSCGVGHLDSILHLGSGYSDNLVFTYLADLKAQNLVQDMAITYSAVDVDQNSLTRITDVNAKLEEPIEVNLYNQSAQLFLDENTNEFGWTIITGLFDKNQYGEQQFQFIDKILAECLKKTTEGVIFTVDTQTEIDDPTYTIQHIIAYIESTYSRYRINRINEYNYVICVNKYYHSIIR